MAISHDNIVSYFKFNEASTNGTAEELVGEFLFGLTKRKYL